MDRQVTWLCHLNTRHPNCPVFRCSEQKVWLIPWLDSLDRFIHKHDLYWNIKLSRQYCYDLFSGLTDRYSNGFIIPRAVIQICTENWNLTFRSSARDLAENGWIIYSWPSLRPNLPKSRSQPPLPNQPMLPPIGWSALTWYKWKIILLSILSEDFIRKERMLLLVGWQGELLGKILRKIT